jgi:anti-anti-sigma regulatory factor
MLKITKIRESERDVSLKLEGKITEQWGALLDGECRAYLRSRKAVFLDCSDVEYIDVRGTEVLNALLHSHVILVNTPPFVTGLLQIGGRHER